MIERLWGNSLMKGKAMKKILVISRLLTSGGAERVACNLASQFEKAGYDVKLLVLDDRNANYKTSAQVIKLPSLKPSTGLKKVVWYYKTLCFVNKIKKEYGITHTISFLNEPDYLNVFSTGSDKRIISIRNNRSRLNKNLLTKIRDRIVFNKADKIVALSYGIENDLVENYHISENKIEVIYNSCDVDSIIKDSALLDEDEIFNNLVDKHIVINLGRLVNQKGQYHLIKAFKRVCENDENAVLVILGQGPLMGELELLIKQLELDKKVFLLGYKANPYPYLVKASLFVFSSLFEGFGNSLLEAMACELPIVSTDCVAGPRELLEPNSDLSKLNTNEIEYAENGILVPVCKKQSDNLLELTKDEEMLADAISRILLDEGLRKRYIERSKVRISDFSEKAIFKKWEEAIF